MFKPFLVAALSLSSAAAWAGAPEYKADPFGDSDFGGSPMILDVAHPSSGRAEVAVMGATSLIDKYNSHTGAVLDVNYQVLDWLGVALSFGFFNGQLTPIVTDPEGIIGNKVTQCRQNGGSDCALQPDVPDFKQLTGSVSAVLVWTPLYGKINVVSEADVNLQIYGLLGGGVNGTRTATVTSDGSAEGYSLSGLDVGDGGMFGDTKAHLAVGAGLRVYVTDWLDLRAEFRDIAFWDSFDFDGNGPEGESSYRSDHYFANVGLGFLLF